MREIIKRDLCLLPLILVLLFCFGELVSARQQLPFSKEKPIWLDFDMESIKEPKGLESGYLFDFANGTIFQQVKHVFDIPRHGRALSGNPREAYNFNTMDEVPDSSWFTNRNGRRRMSLQEIKRGPNTGDGPADGLLTVTRAKTTGVTPGFFVRDQRGDVYVLKFDPPDYPEMTSAAEVIATKLFYAMGYNVPENYIFRFRREQLQLSPDASFTDQLGKKRTMTEEDIDALLKQAARQPDGRYRCLASKFLNGKTLGGFHFQGVRKDDPNDIINHEHRRDLRGLRVFCSWLEHNDIRVGNSMDLYVTEDGRSFVRHYLLDLGSCLGSDTVFPNVPIVGHEYQMDGSEGMKSLFTLGAYQQPWLKRKREVNYPGVGIYSAAYFNPPRWKQNFPLVAFENMTDRDGYWAAKIVGSFTDEQIRAAVETGQITDPDAAQYLADQIITRRDKITRYYYSRRPALDRFKIEKYDDAFVLGFQDLRAEAIGEKENNPVGYDYELYSAAGQKEQIAHGSISGTRLVLSDDLLRKIGACGHTEEDHGVARLSLSRHGEHQAVQVYLYYEESAAMARVVGIQH
jgi:hypothetical protein